MNAGNTYYSDEQDGQWVRYWYDRSLKLWTAHTVDHPSDAGNQTSISQYEPRRELVSLDVNDYLTDGWRD